MDSPDTAELLRRFVRDGCQNAFTALVERYTPVVYGAALRRTGRHAVAAEVTQKVFTELARRAPAMAWDDRLGAWLHRRAIFAAADALKSEGRRLARETEAVRHMQALAPSSADVALLLDEALDHLPHTDRLALTLRYLEERDLQAVGRAMKISDDAAQKRIARALDRLRSVFSRRGLSLSVAALAAGITSEARARMPAGLSKIIVPNALHTASGGGLWFKVWPHLRAALAGSAGVLAIATAPLWTQHRQLAQISPLAASNMAAGKFSTAVPPSAFPAKPVAMPRMEEGLSVEEIIRRVAVLANLKQTPIIEHRGRALMDSLPAGQMLEALALFEREFPSGLPAVGWFTDYFPDKFTDAARQNQTLALAWAEKHLAGELLVSCITCGLGIDRPPSLEKLESWLPRILKKGTNSTATGSITSYILVCLEDRPFAEKVQELVRLASQYQFALPFENIQRLIPKDPAGASTAWGEYWNALEHLQGPALRLSERWQVLTKWVAVDPAAAQACIEKLPPAAASAYALAVAFPEGFPAAKPGSVTSPPEDLTSRLDWLHRIAAPDVFPAGALRVPPKQLVAWLNRHPDQINPVLKSIVPNIISFAVPGNDTARRAEEQVRPLIQLWNETDAAAMQQCIGAIAWDEHRKILQRCAKP